MSWTLRVPSQSSQIASAEGLRKKAWSAAGGRSTASSSNIVHRTTPRRRVGRAFCGWSRATPVSLYPPGVGSSVVDGVGAGVGGAGVGEGVGAGVGAGVGGAGVGEGVGAGVGPGVGGA